MANSKKITNYTGSATEIRIPTSINNVLVREIGNTAFANKGITKITLDAFLDEIPGKPWGATGATVEWLKPNTPSSYEGLCFTANTAGSTVGMALNGTLATMPTLEYSTNAKTWNSFTIGSTTITLTNVGDKVYFRGNNSTFNTDDAGYVYFTMTGSIAASGNIMSLLDKTCVLTEIPTGTSGIFAFLFEGCTALTTAPDLTATVLKNWDYQGIFNECTSLVTPPVISATTLSDGCFYGMFYNCTSLASAPALPVTELMATCYKQMFAGCEALTVAPVLPATTMKTSCYQEMFMGCKGLLAAPTLPATTLAASCYRNMFQDCSNLVTVPQLPATTMYSNCYSGMFNYCSKLYASTVSGSGYTTAWKIPQNGNGSGNYAMTGMFTGCKGTLNKGPNFNGTQITFYTQNTPV